MNTPGILNRVEIVVYSALTSVMSKVNHLRGNVGQTISPADQPTQLAEDPAVYDNQQSHQRSLYMVWNSIQEIVPLLFLWLMLGFAAGFLIGMVQPR